MTALVVSLFVHGVIIMGLSGMIKSRPSPGLRSTDRGIFLLVQTNEPETVPAVSSGAAMDTLKEKTDEDFTVTKTDQGAPGEKNAVQKTKESRAPAPEERIMTLTDINALLMNRIARYKKYPRQAVLNNIEGTVSLFISLDADGNLAHCRVVRSSGYQVLDCDALSLVKKTVPLKHGYGKNLNLVVPVSYRLTEEIPVN